MPYTTNTNGALSENLYWHRLSAHARHPTEQQPAAAENTVQQQKNDNSGGGRDRSDGISVFLDGYKKMPLGAAMETKLFRKQTPLTYKAF